MPISDFALSSLACIECNGDLVKSEKGDLVCLKCNRMYPIKDPGYFDFVSDPKAGPPAEHDISVWDAHWQSAGALDGYIVSQEVDYFNEILPDAFKARVVIDAGCGSGRNLEKFLREKPKLLLMIDISDSLVRVIHKWQRVRDRYPDVEVLFIRCDLSRLPLKTSDEKIVYTSSGVYNILDDQAACIEEAMRFSHDIFILFNSPANVFGKIYYSLNPVRVFFQSAISSDRWRNLVANMASYAGILFVKAFISVFSREVREEFTRQALEFLIIDWIFTSPRSMAHNLSYYHNIGISEFDCFVHEKTISRILYYVRK